MAYKDYTKVAKCYQKRSFSVFCTDWLRPSQAELTDGIVLGYLPENSLVREFGIIKDGTFTLDTPGTAKIQVNGADITKKLYPDGGVIEIKGAETFTKDVRWLIEYVEVALDNGNWTPVPAKVIASDGTVAEA